MSAQPPFLRRGIAKDTGRAGRAAETSLASRLSGEQRPGSGALAGAKGDVTVGDFLVENKTSMSASFSVRQEHLHKIYQESLETGKNPALAFQFVDHLGKSERRDRWVCMPEALFKELTEKS